MKLEKHGIPEVDITQLTGMSASEARAIIWPFKGIRKPIGILLEQGEITIRDIAWAAENAYDSRLMQAAKTILLLRVFPEKMSEPLQPAKTISGSKYTAYQRRRAIALSSLALGVTLGIGVFYFSISGLVFFQKTFVEYFDFYKTLIYNVFGVLLLFVTPAILLWLMSYFERQDEQFAIGEEAEEQALDSFRTLLREPWTIIHNFEFPDRKWGDIDLIVLGSGGVWAFEVKGYTRPVRNIGDRWQYKSQWGWRKLSKHPGNQARRNAARLKDFLDLKGINVGWVDAVVLWASEDIQLENPATSVWKISDLPQIEDFWRKQKLTQEQTEKAVNLLDEAVEKAKTKIKKK